jgi:hypothetical protein
MRRIRILAGLGIVLGLAIGVVANLGDRGPVWWEPPPGVTIATPGTLAPSTLIHTTDDDPGTAGLIRSLYFGWLDAIHRGDTPALDDVLATTPFREAGVAAMDSLDFVASPSLAGIEVREWEVLLETGSCMAVWTVVDLSAALGPGAETSGVDVLWDDGDGWRFASSWVRRDDRWDTDCTGRT